MELPTSDRILHITIGVFPSGKLSLEQDIRLTKAALLYADRVRLYSVKSSMMLMVLKLGDITPKQQLKFLEMTIPYISSGKDAKTTLAFLKKYEKSIRNKHTSPKDRALQRQFQELLTEQWINIKGKTIEIAQEAGIDSVNRAVESGLLEIHTFEGFDNDRMTLEFMSDCIALASQSPLLKSRTAEMSERDDKVTREFVEGISNAVSNGFTYPLFDHQTSGLVEAGIREGLISVSDAGVNRAKHSGLAGHLLERLPLFEQASVDEILDIRRELGRHLVRFRQAVITFSEAIKTASWDEDFPAEAEKVFYRDVAPAILDIEEAVKSNKFLASLARKFVDKPLVMPSGAVLSVIMSQLSALPDEIVKSLGIAVPSAALVYGTYNEWKQKQQVIEQNNLYFYYQAQEQLRSRR